MLLYFSTEQYHITTEINFNKSYLRLLIVALGFYLSQREPT